MQIELEYPYKDLYKHGYLVKIKNLDIMLFYLIQKKIEVLYPMLNI